jgi:hypothetical protein
MTTAMAAPASSQRLAGEGEGAGFHKRLPVQRHSQASPRTGSAIMAVTRNTSSSGACSQATHPPAPRWIQ